MIAIFGIPLAPFIGVLLIIFLYFRELYIVLKYIWFNKMDALEKSTLFPGLVMCMKKFSLYNIA